MTQDYTPLRLVMALEALLGSEDDPKIGWRGEGEGDNHYLYCEFCGARELDYTKQPHEDDCPVTVARDALAKGDT